MVEDFDEPEFEYDTFYVNNGVKSMALKIEEIKSIEIFKEWFNN